MHTAGIDDDIRTEAARVNLRVGANQRAQMSESAACEQMDRGRIMKAAAMQPKRVGQRLRGKRRHHTLDVNVAKDCRRIDFAARVLVGARAFELDRTSEHRRDNRRGVGGVSILPSGVVIRTGASCSDRGGES